MFDLQTRIYFELHWGAAVNHIMEDSDQYELFSATTKLKTKIKISIKKIRLTLYHLNFLDYLLERNLLMMQWN